MRDWVFRAAVAIGQNGKAILTHRFSVRSALREYPSQAAQLGKQAQASGGSDWMFARRKTAGRAKVFDFRV